MKSESKEKEIALVIAAGQGSQPAFEKLLIRYQRRMYGYVMPRAESQADAGDIVQETFLKAWLNLHALNSPENFSQWLYAICKNCVYAYQGDKKKLNEHEISEEVSGIVMAHEQVESEWENYFDSLRVAIALLKQELRDVIQLKYFAGLSYQEISAACGVDEKRVKSRLYEARQKIKQQIPHLYQGLEYDYQQLNDTKEEIMKSIENISNGAYVFERLSLYEQLALCKSVQSGSTFNESLLAGINKIAGGVDFLTRYNARLTLPEVVNILTYVDNNTAFRVFGELENNDPDFAETLKQNIFIFEDILLLDRDALQLLFDRVDHEILKTALANTSPQVRTHVLQLVPNTLRDEWVSDIMDVTPYGLEVKDAQYRVIHECYVMIEEERIRVERTPEGVRLTIKQ
ncbi:MAG: sigma-70 family RNA polymerase sigma factor [bacterium]|nr:sigma-70 family RNA polymerase sigma factor [bacterium]